MAAGAELSNTHAGDIETNIEVRCSPCLGDERSRVAEKYCIDCEMYYCGKCLKYHNRIPSSQGHQIVDKCPSEVGSTITALPTERCLTHHGNLNDMYCGDHDVVCCGECISGKHRTCVKVHYLPDIAKGIKESQDYNEVKGMIHTVLVELQKEETKMQNNIKTLKDDGETILAEMNRHEEDLINKIRAQAQTTRETLYSKMSDIRKTLKEDIRNITSAMTTISLNEENISSGNEAEIFAKVISAKNAIQNCKGFMTGVSCRWSRKRLYYTGMDKLKAAVNESECIGIVNIVEDEKKEKNLKIEVEEQKTDSFNIEMKEDINEKKMNNKLVDEKKMAEINESECMGIVNIVEDEKEVNNLKTEVEEQKTDSFNIELKEDINEKKLNIKFGEEKKMAEISESECMGIVNIVEEEKEEENVNIKVEERKIDSSENKMKESVQDEQLNIELREEKNKHTEVLNYKSTFSRTYTVNKTDSQVTAACTLDNKTLNEDRRRKKTEPKVLQYKATLYGKYTVNESYCWITAACVLGSKGLILFDNTNCILKRLSMYDFRIIDQLNMQVISYSICSVGTQEVAVALCDYKKIQLVSVGPTMTLTKSFSTVHNCRSVAFNEVSREFCVSNGNSKLFVYDMNGKLKKTFDKDRKGRPTFSNACNIAWSEDNASLYVTDKKKGLLALSLSGDLLWTYSDSELKLSQGLCLLSSDVILVSGILSNNVSQVDKNGKKIGTLLDAGDNLTVPYALAYDRKRSKLIVGQESNEIRVYDITKNT